MNTETLHTKTVKPSVPLLRFKKQNGSNYNNWDLIEIEKVLSERNIKSPKSKEYPLKAFVANKGVVPKGERYNRDFLINDEDKKKYKQTEYGDFIYSSNNLESGSIGLNRFGPASISPVYSIFKVDDAYDFKFISNCLIRKNFIKKMIKFRQGVVYGQWRIHESDFLKIKEFIPVKDEQQKIGDFLYKVDTKLQQLTKKKELLEQYKKGVMQQLFSQQLRFKQEDGSDYPDWEYPHANKLFKSISDKNHNGDLPILAISQEFGAIPRELINYKISVEQSSVDGYKVVQIGDFIISLRSFQGGIEYSNYKGICSPAYNILRPTSDNVVHGFYKRYLKTEYYIKQLQRKLEGIRDGKMISYKYFSEIKLPFPCKEEQQDIANYLSGLDTKIESVAQQITQTQQFKKGLLQQMFV